MQAANYYLPLVVSWSRCGVVTVRAHHSWNTVFSEDKPLVLRGTISKVELVNPHAWIWIDVKGDDGTITKWGVEGGPPNGLIRNGITKDSLKIGEELIVHGYGARDETTFQVAGVKYEKSRRPGILACQRRRGSHGQGPRQLEVRARDHLRRRDGGSSCRRCSGAGDGPSAAGADRARRTELPDRQRSTGSQRLLAGAQHRATGISRRMKRRPVLCCSWAPHMPFPPDRASSSTDRSRISLTRWR